jgi:hypothetical protein
VTRSRATKYTFIPIIFGGTNGGTEKQNGGTKKKGSVRDALVAAQFKSLKPGWYCDGRGLYLNVKPSGSRSWILRTMVAGKRREIGLGSRNVGKLR